MACWSVARPAAEFLLLVAVLLALAAPARAWPRGARLPEPQTFSHPDFVARSGRYRVLSFDGHVHTAYSHDARHPVADVLVLAERADLDAVVITDHGSAMALDALEDYDGALTTLVGEEVGGAFGHAVIWDVPDRHGVHEAAIDSLAALGELVHARGGLLVLAHPGWWIGGNTYDPLRWMQYDALRRGGIGEAIDALELWNQQYFRPTRALLDGWDALLARGVFVPVVGNSDFHIVGADRLGEPRNAFLCPLDASGELTQPVDACLVEAVRRGRLYVTDGPTFTLTVAGRVLGETVAAFAHTFLATEVSVTAPEGGTLELRLGRDVVERVELPAGETITRSFAVRVPEHDSYLRVEVLRADPDPVRAPMSLLSNPILIDVLPQRAEGWRGPDEGRVAAPYGYRRDQLEARRRRERRAE